MRNLMLAEFLKIKASENGFKKSKWKYFFVGGYHISEFEPAGIPTDKMFLDFYNELLIWMASRKDIIAREKIHFSHYAVFAESNWKDLLIRLISSPFLIESVSLTDKQGEVWNIEEFNPTTGEIKIKNVINGKELNEKSPSPINSFSVAEIEFTNIPKEIINDITYTTISNKQIFRKK